MDPLKDFISIVEENHIFNSSEQLLLLSKSLDSLANFVNLLGEYSTTESDISPPKINYEKTYQAFKRKFPLLGYYNCVDNITEKISESKINVGDAIDDLVDIYTGVKKVLWLLVNASKEDAFFELKWSYENHWGNHIRNLQLVLHTTISDLRSK